MKKPDKTSNLTNFRPAGDLGVLFEKAKKHNHLNSILKNTFPSQFKGLDLCFLDAQNVTLLAKNSSLGFRAEKQKTELLSLIKKIEGLTNIESITIKVDKKNY